MKKWLQVELTEEMWKSIAKKAIDMGMSRSQWVRDVLHGTLQGASPVSPKAALPAKSLAKSQSEAHVRSKDTTVAPVQSSEIPEPKCKHWFMVPDRECKKCGWVPPL